MQRIFRNTSLALAVIFTTGYAWAEDKATSDKGQKGEKGKITQIHRVSSLMDADVSNQNDESLGEIEDLALTNTGEIRYAIISRGGVLGVGQDYIAVPWKMVKPDFQEETAMLTVDKAKLDNAPKFTKDNYQELSDQAWLNKVDQHFQAEGEKKAVVPDGHSVTEHTQGKGMQLIRASQIIGANVKNAQKESIADVNDLILDSTGCVAFAVIGEGGFLEIGERAVAVPFQALGLHRMEDGLAVTLNMPQEKLQRAPALQKENYQDLTDETFVDNARRFFNVNEQGEVETEAPANRDQDQNRNQNEQGGQRNQDQPRND